MTKEDIISFIENCTPNFNKQDGKYQMFTIVTQHIEADSIEELLEVGIEEYSKFGNHSPVHVMFESFENNCEIVR